MSLNLFPLATQSPYHHTLRGDLVGVGLIIIDAWLSVASLTPVLDACRELLRLGYPDDTVLEVHRNGRLSLIVPNIGEAAELEINSRGNGFTKRRIGPPVRSPEPAAISPTPTRNVAGRGCAPTRPVEGAR
jgi:hypothetical protein